MSVKYYYKLIRDEIPKLIELKGGKANFIVINDDKFKYALKVKMSEEAEELAFAKTKDEMIEEMADIMEVIHATCDAHQINFDDVLQRRIEKKDFKGSFSKHYFLESVED